VPVRVSRSQAKSDDRAGRSWGVRLRTPATIANMPEISSFSSVDHTAEPDFYIRFLDAVKKLPGIIAWKAILIEGLRLRPGARVLDLGCGFGDDTFEVAARVAPGGQATGVDFSRTLIAEAERRAAGRGFNAVFEVGDAQALRFAEPAFDAVRAERLLMHVPDAPQAIREMVRVLRPGGRLAVADFDWESQFCDSPHKETTRKIALAFCDRLKNGWIGRRLPRLFREAGVVDVEVSYSVTTLTYEFLPFLLGHHITQLVQEDALSQLDAELWWDDLARAESEGQFLYGLTAFVVSGTKA
jgi:ubiquinone/menaquinone biosynthesis C-methylase UbiE